MDDINIEQLWAYIEEQGECWVWRGAKMRERYPVYKHKGRTVMAARVLYELAGNTISDRHNIHRTCATPDCVQPSHQRTHAGPDAQRQEQLEARAAATFWSRTSETEDGCWIWNGHVVNTGYGIICIGNRNIPAHRYAYELSTGQAPPKNMLVCHKCDVPRCVNPAHLFLGTHKDNVDDMVAKGRSRINANQNDKKCGRDRDNPVKLRSQRAVFSDAQVLDIRTRYAAGETQVALGKEFGVSNDCIHLIVTNRAYKDLAAPEELPVIRGKDNVLLEQDVLDIVERHAAGETQAHLARQYGVTQTTIWHILKDRGGFTPKPKLTQEQVQQIRDVLATGAQQRVVAKQFNVSDATISKIANTPTA